MNVPKIDNRDAKDILKQIKALAEQYVPEWNYDETDPDVGVVFSKIFATMFENTISRFNRTPYNHYISFLNLLGAKLLPSISSTGMVTVSVVPNSNGVYIEKGTALYASADNDEGRVFYETMDSMYAIDNRIKSILSTDAQEDSIVKIYDSNIDDQMNSFRIFDHTVYDNLQEHVIYFGDDIIFKTKEKSDFILQFYDEQSLKNNEILPDLFLDQHNVTWQYYKEGKWRDISDVQKHENGLRILFDDTTEPCEVMNTQSRFIRCVFHRIPDKDLCLTDITYAAQAKSLTPDALLFDTTELSETDFFPFGEQYYAYSDFYISSDEAFVKKGARVDITIDMQFVKVKVNTEPLPDNTKYKYVMTDLDFQSPEPSDIEIEKVAWEYWNGIGWARLYSDNTNEDFFVAKTGENQKKVLSFVCPDNIETIVLGPYDSCFIRARILKVKNPFNVMGNYITPYIHTVTIDYDYPDAMRKCDKLLIHSNMKNDIILLSENERKPLLKKMLCEHPTMYFCLDKPIVKGPTRILFDIETGLFYDNPSLRWEYYAKNKQGEFEWQNIEVMDMTENFSHSAIVTVIGKNNFTKTTLFGQEGYFLRILNHDNRYSCKKNTRSHPLVNGIHLNTVQVFQRESHVPEYFSIENGEENKVCRLSSKNISEARVWVNEFEKLSTNEEEFYIESRDDLAKIEYDQKGSVSAIWVEWKAIPSIAAAGPLERAFEIDYNKGQILFGNGKHGKIPPYQEQQSIKVVYSMSEGSIGNIGKNEILGFSDAVPYVNSVVNLKPMIGGVDMETVDYSAKRISGKLSGMDRIVTLDDFENCICYNDRNISRVKCMAHTNELSEPEMGTISIAVLPKDYMQGYEKFLVLKDRINEFVQSKAALTLVNPSKIQIFEVMYVEVSISLDIVIKDYNCYQSVYQTIYKKLVEFLDPITGNFDRSGWKIGELPRKEIIYNYIKSVKDIKWIKSIYMFTKVVTLDGKKEIDFEEVKKQFFTVPIFGEPEINVSID